MVPPIMVGLVVKVFAFRVVPVPWMTVLTVSLSVALSFGMFTAGVVPNAPLTFTAELAFAVGLAAGAGFDEPQAAMTRQASSGRAMIARKRRMKTSGISDFGGVSLLGWTS